MTKKTDDTGLDLYIANDPRVINSSNTKALVKRLKERSQKQTNGVPSNILDCLSTVLEDYQKQPRHYAVKPKKRNIYIFTTGVWDTKEKAGGLGAPIRNLVEYFENNNQSGRPVCIQFIQFGHENEGSANLEYLDKLKVHDPRVTR
jgi:hypothetical protein